MERGKYNTTGIINFATEIYDVPKDKISTLYSLNETFKDYIDKLYQPIIELREKQILKGLEDKNEFLKKNKDNLGIIKILHNNKNILMK